MRVTLDRHWHFDQVGKVIGFDPDMQMQYAVHFAADDSTSYFAAHDLVLAPHPEEG